MQTRLRLSATVINGPPCPLMNQPALATGARAQPELKSISFLCSLFGWFSYCFWMNISVFGTGGRGHRANLKKKPQFLLRIQSIFEQWKIDFFSRATDRPTTSCMDLRIVPQDRVGWTKRYWLKYKFRCGMGRENQKNEIIADEVIIKHRSLYLSSSLLASMPSSPPLLLMHTHRPPTPIRHNRLALLPSSNTYLDSTFFISFSCLFFREFPEPQLLRPTAHQQTNVHRDQEYVNIKGWEVEDEKTFFFFLKNKVKQIFSRSE